MKQDLNEVFLFFCFVFLQSKSVWRRDSQARGRQAQESLLFGLGSSLLTKVAKETIRLLKTCTATQLGPERSTRRNELANSVLTAEVVDFKARATLVER